MTTEQRKQYIQEYIDSAIWKAKNDRYWVATPESVKDFIASDDQKDTELVNAVQEALKPYYNMTKTPGPNDYGGKEGLNKALADQGQAPLQGETGFQNQQTEFEKYFKEERAKGRTPEDILQDNPFIQKETVSVTGMEKTPMQYKNAQGQIIDLKNYPNMTDSDLRAQGWTPVSETTPQATGGHTAQDNSQNGNSKTDEMPKMPQPIIDKVYQAFGRFPTDQDIKNYNYNSEVFEKQLDTEISKKEEEKKTEETKMQTEEEKANTEAALKIIDEAISSGQIPPEMGDLWKTVVGNYQGTSFDQQEILNAFNKTKQEVIDPYYKELTDVAIKDFQTAFQNLEGSRERELEVERANAGEDIRQAKAGLETSGMTFTGKGVQELGGQSAYAQEPNANVTTPTQTPFGGMFYEGNVNQRNRLMASSSMANYQNSLQNLGRQAETRLGTAGASGLGINYTPTGVTQGTLAQEKQQKEASTLQDYINQWQEKQKLLTNKTLTT